MNRTTIEQTPKHTRTRRAPRTPAAANNGVFEFLYVSNTSPFFSLAARTGDAFSPGRKKKAYLTQTSANFVRRLIWDLTCHVETNVSFLHLPRPRILLLGSERAWHSNGLTGGFHGNGKFFTSMGGRFSRTIRAQKHRGRARENSFRVDTLFVKDEKMKIPMK